MALRQSRPRGLFISTPRVSGAVSALTVAPATSSFLCNVFVHPYDEAAARHRAVDYVVVHHSIGFSKSILIFSFIRKTVVTR